MEEGIIEEENPNKSLSGCLSHSDRSIRENPVELAINTQKTQTSSKSIAYSTMTSRQRNNRVLMKRPDSLKK